MFGNTEYSGHMTFYDDWIYPDCLTGNGRNDLVLDIMTPHHGDYYSGKMNSTGSDRVPPTDMDSPNPIAFHSVTGHCWVSVECDTPSDPLARQLSDLTNEVVSESLEEWGLGDKTSSCYGANVH